MYEGYGGTQVATLRESMNEGLNYAPGDWMHKEMLKTPNGATPSWKAKLRVTFRIILDDSYNTRPPGLERKLAMSIVSSDGRKTPWSYTYQIPFIPERVNNSNRTFEKTWYDIDFDFENYEIRAVGTLRPFIRELEIKVERFVAAPEFKPIAKCEEIGGGKDK